MDRHFPVAIPRATKSKIMSNKGNMGTGEPKAYIYQLVVGVLARRRVVLDHHLGKGLVLLEPLGFLVRVLVQLVHVLEECSSPQLDPDVGDAVGQRDDGLYNFLAFLGGRSVTHGD